MDEKADAELLREYVERNDEDAFATIVQRHTSLIYSVGMRLAESPEIAAEISQTVFVALAQGAKPLCDRLAPQATLAGWLCRTARNACLNHRRNEHRRRLRERLAMESANTFTDTPDWEKLRPVLDEALAELNESDCDAIVLRFFHNQDLRAVGSALGVSDDTAQKRVSRALDKLKGLLNSRGVGATAAVLAATLSANAIQPSPLGLAALISPAALAGIANGAKFVSVSKAILMTTLQKSIVTSVIAAAIGTSIFEAYQASKLAKENQALRQQQTQVTELLQQLRQDGDDLSAKLAALTKENASLKTRAAQGARARLAALQQSSASPAVDPAAQIAHKNLTELPKSSWTDAGFATPEDALKTRGWAVLNGNREKFAKSVSITPGARKMVEDMIVQMASASTAPDRDQLIQQALANKWGAEEAVLMPMMALNDQNKFTGYRILSQQATSDDDMTMQVQTEMAAAPPETENLKLHRFGADWKVVIDEDTIRANK